jgi:hypothetical protein
MFNFGPGFLEKASSCYKSLIFAKLPENLTQADKPTSDEFFTSSCLAKIYVYSASTIGKLWSLDHQFSLEQ